MSLPGTNTETAGTSIRVSHRPLVVNLQEAMDNVDNYGVIHCPEGKSIVTRNLTNRAGASITGDGVLLVRFDLQMIEATP